MTTHSSPSAPTAAAPGLHRRAVRFFTQFSLRTLLAATTLAAVGCWWYLRPAEQAEELAGEHLTLRRQVRLNSPAPPANAAYINIGAWQLRNEQGHALVDGRYSDDLPHGKWTLWHASGRRAAEGTLYRGARSGVWQTWDDAGQLRSEVTYQPRERWSYMSGIHLMPAGKQRVVPPIAMRHGACRGWHANGQLQFEGAYRDDRRDGLWTWYDGQGSLVEQGTYRADVREGTWTERSIATQYIAGQPQNIHNELLVKLAADLRSGHVRRQVAAAARLEELGPAGVPLLAQLLAQDSDVAKLLSLRALVRRNAVPAELLPKIEPLADHADSRLALRAMLAIYQLRPERREDLIQRVITMARRAGNHDALVEATTIVYRADQERRQLAVNTLVDQFAGERVELPGYGTEVTGPNEALIDAVCRLGDDVLVHLAVAFDSPRAEVRQFVIIAIDTLVKRGPSQSVSLPNNRYEMRWEIPQCVEQVLIRAKADPEPAVRAAAEWVGRQPEYGTQSFVGSGFF